MFPESIVTRPLLSAQTDSSLVHHSLHQIAHHIDHDLHGAARDPIYGHSWPLEDGVQCWSDVLIAGLVLGLAEKSQKT